VEGRRMEGKKEGMDEWWKREGIDGGREEVCMEG
jgi:hypothetical protein